VNTGILGALAPVLVATVVGACSVVGGKAADEPAYELELQDGAFEIRRYQPMVVAVTRVESEDYDDAVSTGFRRLFGYITGDNQGAAEIAMTAPVLTESGAAGGGGGEGEGDEIAMTAPVLQEEAPGGWDVTFVLPEEMTLETAPRPTDGRIRIEEVPARRVAVARFSGFLSAENIAENRAALKLWLSGRAETAAAPASAWAAAGYNPPWTIPWARRNEIIAALE